MRRIIYRAVSLLVAASMVSSLFVMPVWAVGTSYGDQYNEAGEFIIDNNKSDSNAITEPGVEKTQNETQEIKEEKQETKPIDESTEIVDVIDTTKPQIVKEKEATQKEVQKKESKAGMVLVVTILLILILVVLFLPQLSSLLA